MNKKKEVVTFKVDLALYEKIKDIPNRSEFIRNAIFKELGAICPLCAGKGMLDPAQKKHWDAFSVDHSLKRCEHCDSFILSCSHS
jgi:hypothetical protein